MLRDHLESLVSSSVDSLIASGKLPASVRDVAVEILEPKQPEHGDYACNFAMVAAKSASMNPRVIGELLAGELQRSEEVFASIDVAGPGFLNLRLQPAWISAFVPVLLEKGASLAQSTTPNPQKINVEFVSVNPNGPITIGSGRGAAYGSTLCNVLEAAGNSVHREYYINDGVNSEQMALFAKSVSALLNGDPVPDNGYKGDYVAEIAKRLEGKADPHDIPTIQDMAQRSMLEAQHGALESFGTTFDTWFSEQSLHDSGIVAAEITKMASSGIADEREVRTVLKLAKGGAIEEVNVEVQLDVKGDDTPNEEGRVGSAILPTLWLRSTKFGDDMDRVLRRRDGRLTYIASDVAYHMDKLTDASTTRGTGEVDRMITILGPDHHGYIGRLQAVVAAMLMAEGMIEESAGDPQTFTEIEDKIYGSAQERDQCRAALDEAKRKLEVQIYQLVRFMKDGKPAPMRKRDGNIYALIDLMREIGDKVKPNGTTEEKLTAGKDVARFFYLMRSHDTTFDFDLDLAEKQSDENPVFYVQYAHARICGVIDKAGASTLAGDPSLLVHPAELALIKKILDLPWEVRRSAQDYGVHRLTTYSIELARTFHHFYDACRVILPEDPALGAARLDLCRAARHALQATLALLGVSAPEKMERAAIQEPVA